MALTTRTLHPRFGVEIQDVDLTRIDHTTFKDIVGAFNESSLLLFRNPVNGRKGFYVGSHACEIVGMPTDEARALLRELREAATRPGLVYRHRWQPGDLVMWDNRCMLHRGRPWDESKYRRVMHRTTVAGDGPTAPDDSPAPAVSPARDLDVAWGRSQLVAV